LRVAKRIHHLHRLHLKRPLAVLGEHRHNWSGAQGSGRRGGRSDWLLSCGYTRQAFGMAG
jgi:hypothetical protein